MDSQPDALLLLGDLQYSINVVLRSFPGVPAFGVPGNHDSKELFDGLPVINLHGRRVSWKGINLAGVGGCLRYKPCDLSWLFWEQEYAEILSKLPPTDLLITHCAPFGSWQEPPDRKVGTYHHAHSGSRALRDYIVRNSPRLVLHGHIHKKGVTELGKTAVRSVYSVEIVQFTM